MIFFMTCDELGRVFQNIVTSQQYYYNQLDCEWLARLFVLHLGLMYIQWT